MRNLLYLLACVCFILLISCEQEEGVGGTSSIKGKVWVKDYNGNFTYLIDTFYGGDIDVYIIYGNDDVYSDRYATNYDGTYRFDYLREGSYKVFAYSKDSAGYPSEKKIPVIKEVKITDKDQEVVVEDIVILD
ncbi:MAG: hypothetical protein JW973_15035 [Bacteroidales bacterium]|nr:hypothetical protein [Bacteroidales bacterium]